MKYVIYIILGLGALIGIILLFRKFSTPSFSIEQFDRINKSGYFLFAGLKNEFSFSNSGIYTSNGHSGYVVHYGIVPSKIQNPDIMTLLPLQQKFAFDLYKDGKFIKNLQTITA